MGPKIWVVTYFCCIPVYQITFDIFEKKPEMLDHAWSPHVYPRGKIKHTRFSEKGLAMKEEGLEGEKKGGS